MHGLHASHALIAQSAGRGSGALLSIGSCDGLACRVGLLRRLRPMQRHEGVWGTHTGGWGQAGAVKACAAVGQSLDGASGAEYKLDDLICFLCLSQHKEAVNTPGMPAPARPVSIEEDLSLDLLRLRCLQAPPLPIFDNPSEEAQAPSPAPEQGAVQPLKHRRWRAHTLLLQPLAQQPTWRPLVSFEFPLARVDGGYVALASHRFSDFSRSMLSLPAWRRTLPSWAHRRWLYARCRLCRRHNVPSSKSCCPRQGGGQKEYDDADCGLRVGLA